MAGQIREAAERFNRSCPLAEYLIPFIGHKKEVKIADVGSGPFSTIGNYLDNIQIKVYPSDRKSFDLFWKRECLVPLFPVEIQNMERLTYEDNFFDIVTCINALDHTKDALSAVREIIRVTKSGGWVYIDCNLDQLDTGHRHFWNVKADGRFVSKAFSFDLKELGFGIKFVDLGGESRYNHIVATLKKQTTDKQICQY